MSPPVSKLEPSPSLRAFLEKQPWYRALSAELRSLVLNTVCERTAGPGDYIARSGEPSAHWYGLIRGFLQMYVVGSDGAETTLYCMREGEWGGDGSLLKRERRRCDFLCEIMNERIGVFVGMLEASRLRAPEMRLARALLMLADRKAEGSQEISIPQHELALICGLSRSPSRHEGRLPASHAFGAARCSFDARVCPDAGSGLLY